jgi:hypothetical protein
MNANANSGINIHNIAASFFSGIFTVAVFLVVTNLVPVKDRLALFGIVNKWLVLSVFLFIFGTIKHEIAYYLTIESSYCKQTNICYRLLNRTEPSVVDYIKKYLSFGQNVWIESAGEGLVFLLIGLPVFVSINNKYFAAFITGILADALSEYSGVHKYFCKTSCGINPLDVGQKEASKKSG